MKLTPMREQALQAMARKLTRCAPELYEDVCQEGRLALHLFQPWQLRGVRARDAYLRQYCWNKMVDAMRRELGRRGRGMVELSRREHIGDPTYRDLGLEEEQFQEDALLHPRRTSSWYRPHARAIPVADPLAALDDRLSCDLLLGGLAAPERLLLEYCFGLRPLPDCDRPQPRLTDVALHLGLHSESNLRYHRDRLITALQERMGP
jgi:DNA-directed RNA polymerase specialized sigma24 family protein